jgi:probable F420-dependent oxidoreductase
VTRLGVAFGSGLAPRDVVACVRAAEELGYESAWIAEGHGGDQFALLAACAQVTRRIRLATGISSVFVRSAPTIAMAAATVDDLSGGRLVLGLGSSHRVQVEPEHGVPFVQPTARLRETVSVVRALLRDGVVSHRGDVLAIERFDLWFRPWRPAVPIYLAALFPPLLELCGEIAEGALLTWPTLAAGGRAAAAVARGAARAGRRPEDVDLASLLPCVTAPTRAEARDRMRAPLAFYAAHFPRYRRLFAESGFADSVERVHALWEAGDRDGAARGVPDGLIDAVAVAGTPEECRARVEAYRRSGIRLPVLAPRVAGPDARDQALAALRACAP